MADSIEQDKAATELEEAYDTSDPKQVNTARKKAARTRADRLRFVKAAMEQEEGRAWFYDQLVYCKIFSTPFSEDPYITSFKCGQQECGRRILADIQDSAPAEYLLMIRENKTKNG